MMTDAVVLAGGKMEMERFQGMDPSVSAKAGIPLLGKPMVWWTVRAIRACPSIRRIIVLGGAGLNLSELRDLDITMVPEASTLSGALRAGLDALPDADRVFCISADVPLLTPEAVGDLLDHSPAADLVIPFCERTDIERDFPGRGWSFTRLSGSDYTACGGFVAKRAALLERWKWVEGVLNTRRFSILGMAMVMGPAFAIKLALHRLRVAEVEDRMSLLLRVRTKGYRTRFTELAMDVDETSDIAFVESALRSRGA
jgi:molybdopterin-guanine dinucleotide biosynthesis protein A